jgi:hypothetical protein
LETDREKAGTAEPPMKTVVIGPGPAGTLLVPGDPDNPTSVLIQNVDPLNTVYLGNDSGVNSQNPNENAPLAPNQSVIASGRHPVFGIAAPGQNVAVALYVGVTSFFLPPSLASLGGAQVYVQSTAPPNVSSNPIPLNSIWFDTANGSLQTWNGTAWQNQQLNAAQAIQAASILSAQIAASAITTSLIANGAVGAAQVASGSLTSAQLAAAAGILGSQIANATIQGSNIAANTIVAANIAANTITASQLAAGIVYAGIVNGTTIQGAQFVAYGSSGEILVYSASPALGDLIGSWSAVSGSDTPGNAYPAGLTVGPVSGVQLNLSAAGGAALQFLLNSASFGNPVLQAAIASFAQVANFGPSKVGHADHVDVLTNSSDGSSSASAQFGYTDTGGTTHLFLNVSAAGTAIAAGSISAVTPGTGTPATPATTESWHAITMDAGWSSVAGYNIPQYRMLPDGNLHLAGNANSGASQTATKTLNSSNPLPAAYRPGVTKVFRSWMSIGARGGVQIDSTGVITMLANATYPAQYCEIDAVLKVP